VNDCRSPRKGLHKAARAGRIAHTKKERSQMKTMKLAGLLAISLAVSGCLATDTERGLAGAAGGAVIADVTGGNALTGAVIGGAAGVFCDDAGICR
jgi:hypothetical protein